MTMPDHQSQRDDSQHGDPQRDDTQRDDIRHQIATAFSRAAPCYDQYAHLQRAVADHLAARLAELPRPSGQFVLEIGCGTGLVTRSLMVLQPSWLSEFQWVLTDIAPPMLRQSADRLAGYPAGVSFVACDAERLPFYENCFGLIYASLVLQWVSDLPATLARLSACLVPGGVLLVTLFAAGSFREWSAARRAHGLPDTMPINPDPADLGAVWPTGRQGRVLADQYYHHHYPDALTFLRELRGLGATTPPGGYVPSNAGALRSLLRDLPIPFTVTYRVVTLCCYRASD